MAQMMTPKQEKFCLIYRETGNASEAALKAGIEWPVKPIGFYVYFLIDDRKIFYVGKGKRDRVYSHRKQANNPNATNQVKLAKIRSALADGCFRELIFCDGMDELEAYRLEKSLIKEFKPELTNMSNGVTHPLESLMAGIDLRVSKIKPFEEWNRTSSQSVKELAKRTHGGMKETYDWIISLFAEDRDFAAKQLTKVKGYNNAHK